MFDRNTLKRWIEGAVGGGSLLALIRLTGESTQPLPLATIAVHVLAMFGFACFAALRTCSLPKRCRLSISDAVAMAVGAAAMDVLFFGVKW